MGIQIPQSPTSPVAATYAAPRSGAISTAEIKARIEAMFDDRDRGSVARNTV
ncbi:hypothetical protein ACFRFQ_11475 [Rhodococcus sp. NPDC056743]|uniref:hypothetical protein n=1 Tax=Rhodococcus sp. NPDC056743 TaxID=3345934 RepID=UPI003670A990